MKHPIDLFLKNSLSNSKENEIPSFEEFQKYTSEFNDSNSLDSWLNQKMSVESQENLGFSEFLKYQEEKEILQHPLDQWLNNQIAKSPRLGSTNFQEFIRIWNQKIIQKWIQRAAIFLLLFLAGWSMKTWNNSHQPRLSPNSKLAISKNSSSQPKLESTNSIPKVSSQKFGPSRNTVSISSKLLSTKTSNFLLKSHFSPKAKLKKKTSLKQINSSWNKNQFSSRVATQVLTSQNDNKSHSTTSLTEKIDLNSTSKEVFDWLFLKTKTPFLGSKFSRDDEILRIKSNSRKRNFIQAQLIGGLSKQKLDFKGEKNRHWDPLQRWINTPQINFNLQYFQPLHKGFGWGLGVNYIQSQMKKEVEFHITEIPVLDSLSGKILGYIPLGPRGQIHVEEEMIIHQNHFNIQGSIFKSYKLTPSFEVGIQQNLGVGVQNTSFEKIIDPISLDFVSASNSRNLEMVGKSSLWVQSRISNHWGIGAQMSRPISVKFANKNDLIFREMSIFEAGVSVRYYLNQQ